MSISSCRNFLLLALVVLGIASMVRAQADCRGTEILTAATCAGDEVGAQEKALYDLIQKFRGRNGLQNIRLSASLSAVANRHLLDLKHNLGTFSHSWSNCAYDVKAESTWHCTSDAPRRLRSGYAGSGYETLFRTAAANVIADAALEAWAKSELHSSIILNRGVFGEVMWDEVGVAIVGQYAALWFGSAQAAKKPVAAEGIGLGTTYEEAVAGLTEIFAIKESDATSDAIRWVGTAPDRKMTIELTGKRTDIHNASLAVSIKLDAGELSSTAASAMSTLLRNFFPEWKDHRQWLDSALAAIAANPTAYRTKLLRNASVEVVSAPVGTVNLRIAPRKALSPIEVH